MEAQYIIEFEITPALYREWGRAPMGRKALSNRRIHRVLMAILLVCGVMSVGIGIMLQEFYEIMLGVLFLAVALLRLFVLPSVSCKRQHQMMLKALMRDRWVRTISFAEIISITDGNSVMFIDYGEITGTSQDSRYFYLWRGEDFIIRIPKDCFIKGEPKDFPAFLEAARGQVKV